MTTDEQWRALVAAIGSPAWATDSTLETAAERHRRHDEIDGHLADWCAERSGDEIVDRLWEADVPVAKVMQPHEQATLVQLQHRGFFEDVDHPITGIARHSTLPMRFSCGPDRFHRRHAPLLGEHTEAVLGGLGVSEEELARLQVRWCHRPCTIRAIVRRRLPFDP